MVMQQLILDNFSARHCTIYAMQGSAKEEELELGSCQESFAAKRPNADTWYEDSLLLNLPTKMQKQAWEERG